MPGRRSLLGAGLVGLVGGCVAPNGLAPDRPVPRGTIPLALVARDLHIDIGLAVEQVPEPLRTAWMRGLRQGEQISFGFGQRDYMMHEAPGSAEALRALLPSSGVVAIGWLPRQAAQVTGAYDATELSVDNAGLDGLLRYVDGQIIRDAEGVVRAIGDRPISGRNLFDSRQGYDMTFTCNTWIAAALRAADLPFETAGVVWPRQVMGQAHRIAAAQSAA